LPENRSFKVAILGAGIGAEHLDGYLAHDDRFQVAVVCDLDRDRAQALADKATGATTTPEIQAVLDDPTIDIVDICLPPWMHHETALRALQAGKHVVCEKPIAASVEQADQLAAAAASADRLFFPVFQYRFGQGARQLRHLVSTGLAGIAYSASLETHWDRAGAYYEAAPWRGTWRGELGGALVSHAIHAHDLLCFLLGPVARVAAFQGTRVNDVENDDCASIALEMENGALATSSITLGAAENTSRLKFCFQHVTAESGTSPYHPGGEGWRFTARPPMGQDSLDAALSAVPPGLDRFAGLFGELARALDGRDADVVSLADGRRSLELASAIYASARRGVAIPLPLLPDDPIRRSWLPEDS